MFTSFADLERAMLNDLASDAWRTLQSYSLSSGGSTRAFTYRSFAEFKAILDFVQAEAKKERGPSYHGRTLAGQSGYGRHGGRL